MPSRCCVPLCKGNYPDGPKVSIYRFPKQEEEIKVWVQRIQRKDFWPNKNSRICELHFTEGDFETESSAYNTKTGTLCSAPLKVRVLKSNATPSVFSNYPQCNVSTIEPTRECPEKKRTERELMFVKKCISQSIDTFDSYNKTRQLNSLQDLKKCINIFGTSDYWTFFEDNCKSLFLLHIETEPVPFIKYSVKIDDHMYLTVSFGKNSIKNLLNYSFPIKVQNFNEVTNILDHIQNNLNSTDSHNQIKSVIDLVNNLLVNIKIDENENIIIFVQQQLENLLFSSNNFHYSTDILIFSCILKSISPSAYNFIRQSGNVILPHPETLRKICNQLQISPVLELIDDNFLMYITNRVKFLQEHEKRVVLMIDEIHIKPFFDYKGGSVVGTAFNSNNAATSAFVFMISSILSTFKEVAHILPVYTINFKISHDMIKKVIIGLENIGLKVICVVTDNNSINSRAMSLFVDPSQRSIVYPHPINKNRPLFFLIDSVHNFRNIRNNWLNQKNLGTCFFYPDFEDPLNTNFKTASFMALRKIYDIESNEIIKYSKGLSLKSLFPTNLERQNVKTVLKFFNKFVIEALLDLGSKYDVAHYKDTAMFIDIICKWWNIMNVKNVNKGIHQRNVFMEPLNGKEFDEKNTFLNKFLIWLDAWENMKCSTGTLSKETHKALVQTTHGMLELTQYCINECKMKFILSGKIQTDCLESRFGKYRQMASSQYHISMRQLFECKNKLRLQSCVKLELLLGSSIVPLTNFNVESSDIVLVKENNFKNLPDIFIDKIALSNLKPYLPVMTYISGYCSHTVIKKLKCSYCRESLILESDTNLDENYNLIKNLNHGGLKCPTPFVVTVVSYNYIVVNSLYLNSHLLTKMNNQKLTIINLALNVLKDREIILDLECPNGHDNDYISKLILSVSTNVLLKNICNKENDNLTKLKEMKNNIKKRKLEVLKKC